MEDEDVLARSTLCTVTKLDGDTLEIQIGAAIVRLPARDVASLAGTLQRVVRRVFVKRDESPARHALRVLPGGRA
jgi:hypothetical protein